MPRHAQHLEGDEQRGGVALVYALDPTAVANSYQRRSGRALDRLGDRSFRIVGRTAVLQAERVPVVLAAALSAFWEKEFFVERSTAVT
jgi:hypothetical protein